MKKLFVCFLLPVLILDTCQKPSVVLDFKTDFGNMRIQLFDDTPRHGRLFLELVESGFFKKNNIRQVNRDFINFGYHKTGYLKLPLEGQHPVLRGSLAMHTPGVHAMGSTMFFLIPGNPQTEASLLEIEKKRGQQFSAEARAAYLKNGGLPEWEGSVTVIGRVVEGIDALDKIAAVPTEKGEHPLRNIGFSIEKRLEN